MTLSIILTDWINQESGNIFWMVKKKPAASKRDPEKDGNPWQWVEVEWEEVLGITAEKMAQARDKHGPDSLGFLTSAKCLNEENYLMNKLARQAIGTNSLDHCARL